MLDNNYNVGAGVGGEQTIVIVPTFIFCHSEYDHLSFLDQNPGWPGHRAGPSQGGGKGDHD